MQSLPRTAAEPGRLADSLPSTSCPSACSSLATTAVGLQEYFEFVEFQRRRDAIELQKKYKLIGPLITKVEGLVFNTNTSQSPKMTAYYAYWERQILATLTEVPLSTLHLYLD